MAYLNLKILVIDPTLSLRSSMKNVLIQIGQPNVKLKNDARELYSLTKAINFDVIFINVNAGHGLSGPDLIRFLTRACLVSSWCKFVLMSTDKSYRLTSPIFRHLQTQVIYLPVDFPTLKNIIHCSVISIKTLKPLLTKLHKIPPKQLVKAVSDIHVKLQEPVVHDELLSLKLKLLLQGKRPDLALKLAEGLNSDTCRIRENLYISFTTGQLLRFENALKEAWDTNILREGSVYFRCNQLILHRKYKEALEYFQKIPTAQLRANGIEVRALLQQKVQGLRSAFEFLDERLSQADKKSLSYHSLVLAKLKICFIAMLTEQFEYYDQMELYLYIEDLFENKGWSAESFKYSRYKSFARLGLLILEGSVEAEAVYHELKQNLANLDTSQLNILLFAANCFKNFEDSQVIHEQLEKLLARVEVSPELLSHRIYHHAIMETSMDKERYRSRLEFLGLNHWQAGRHYRALAKYKEIHDNFELPSDFLLQYKRLIKEAGLSSFWEVTLL